VNCEVCGTELPHGALFCGECGRAVSVRTVRAESESEVAADVAPAAAPPMPNPQWADDLFSEDAAHEELGPDESAPEDDEFIGASKLEKASDEPTEQSETQAETSPPAAQASDTVIIDPFDLESLAQMPAVVPIVQDAGAPEPVEVPAPLPSSAIGDELLSDDIEQDLPADFDDPELVDEPEPVLEPEPVEGSGESDSSSGPDGQAPAAPAASVRPDPFPWGEPGAAPAMAAALASVDPDELEQTLIVPRRETGERFVLQFSTGESVTVFGTGLLGRNPAPQPGEYFDQLVSISDPGKSVSKTHLEFGQETGSFWVSDRFSGNGSLVREPGAVPKRLQPGKRYRIVRGSRVDIGEQFFVVS
jgi:hypothetical protein